MFVLKTHKKWVPPLQMKKKRHFMWLHAHVTWELETKGLHQVIKCVLDRGHKGICTWESFGIPKSNSVSLGALYAYLSGVQRRTRHIQQPMLAVPDLVSNTQKN